MPDLDRAFPTIPPAVPPEAPMASGEDELVAPAMSTAELVAALRDYTAGARIVAAREQVCVAAGCTHIAVTYDGRCNGCWPCDSCHAAQNGYTEYRRFAVNDQTVCQSCLDGAYLCERCDLYTLDANECADCCVDDDDDDDDELGRCTCNVGCSCCNHQSHCAYAGMTSREVRVAHGGTRTIFARPDARYRGRLIQDYSYRPTLNFHGEGNLFMGVEIEVEMTRGADRDTVAAIAVDGLGDLGYLKSDGSLVNGFEIVTHPMSYDWAMEHFPWGLLEKLRDAGARATSRAGIHVHVSRAGFDGPCHMMKWMKFVYRNESNVTALAGRESDRWAAFRHEHRAMIAEFAKGSTQAERYSAINVQNAATLEMRIFESTLKPERLQAFFGFAAGSVEYTRALTTGDILKAKGWEWPAFTGWLAKNEIYAPLVAHLNTRRTKPTRNKGVQIEAYKSVMEEMRAAQRRERAYQRSREAARAAEDERYRIAADEEYARARARAEWRTAQGV